MAWLGLGIQHGFAPAGGLGGWAVGSTPAFLPEGHRLALAKGSDLILQLHFHPTGKPETERSTVGLYFADKPPERKLIGVGLPALFGIGAGIDIPAGEKDLHHQGLHHAAGGRARAVRSWRTRTISARKSKRPPRCRTARSQPLLWIQDWDFNWQDRYAYKTAGAAAEGHAHRRPDHLRQLRGQPAQSLQSAAARECGGSVVRRDGRGRIPDGGSPEDDAHPPAGGRQA